MYKENAEKRIAFFDFDGTLTDYEVGTWDFLNDRLGVPDSVIAQENKHYLDFIDGLIDYETLAQFDYNVFKIAGLKESDVIAAGRNIKVRNGVEKLFQKLNDKGIPIYLSSGNIKHVIESALGNNIMQYVSGINATEFNFDENGDLSSYRPINADTIGKAKFINKVLKHYYFEPEDAIFFGDGKNDEYVALTGIDTICVNPHNKNLTDFSNPKYWKGVVRTDNLLDLLPIVEGRGGELNKYTSNYEYVPNFQ